MIIITQTNKTDNDYTIARTMNFYLILSTLLLSNILVIHGLSTDQTLAISLTLSIILCLAVTLCSVCVLIGCVWDRFCVKKVVICSSSAV